MRKLFGTLALVFTLSGCGSVRQFLFPFWPQGATDSTRQSLVTPPFLLQGGAARHQDSLMDRLKFLETSPPPKGLSLRALAFRNSPDSSVQLVATYMDDLRLNSHGLSMQQSRSRENDRILALRPLWIQTRQAKLSHPLVIRSIFLSRDYLFQNSRMQEDTVEVVLPDSLPKPRK